MSGISSRAGVWLCSTGNIIAGENACFENNVAAPYRCWLIHVTETNSSVLELWSNCARIVYLNNYRLHTHAFIFRLSDTNFSYPLIGLWWRCVSHFRCGKTAINMYSVNLHYFAPARTVTYIFYGANLAHTIIFIVNRYYASFRRNPHPNGDGIQFCVLELFTFSICFHLRCWRKQSVC